MEWRRGRMGQTNVPRPPVKRLYLPLIICQPIRAAEWQMPAGICHWWIGNILPRTLTGGVTCSSVRFANKWVRSRSRKSSCSRSVSTVDSNDCDVANDDYVRVILLLSATVRPLALYWLPPFGA